MTCNQAPYPSSDDQRLENNRASLVSQRLVEKRQNGHKSAGIEQVVQITHAKEHADGIGPRGNEANSNGAHDGDGDHFLGAMDFFCKVGGTVETGEGPVCVD